jgi:hypothetical protein
MWLGFRPVLSVYEDILYRCIPRVKRLCTLNDAVLMWTLGDGAHVLGVRCCHKVIAFCIRISKSQFLMWMYFTLVLTAYVDIL